MSNSSQNYERIVLDNDLLDAKNQLLDFDNRELHREKIDYLKNELNTCSSANSFIGQGRPNFESVKSNRKSGVTDIDYDYLKTDSESLDTKKQLEEQQDQFQNI